MQGAGFGACSVRLPESTYNEFGQRRALWTRALHDLMQIALLYRCDTRNRRTGLSRNDSLPAVNEATSLLLWVSIVGFQNLGDVPVPA